MSQPSTPKTGRPRKTASERRDHRNLTVSLTGRELGAIDSARGREPRATWARRMLLAAVRHTDSFTPSETAPFSAGNGADC